MPKITVNGAELYYEQQGSGAETIVFGHSMLFNCRMFDAQVEALKDRYRCLLFDWRGQGQSEITDDGYDMDTLYEDAAELIEKLGDPPVHFLGFSMGGFVGLRLAIRRPELLRSLILVDTSAEPQASENLRQAKMLRFATRWLGPRMTVGRVIPFFFSENFLNDPDRQDQLDEWRGHFMANDRVGVSRAVQGVLEREGVDDELDKIQLPTLIMCGEQDILTRLDVSERMQAGIEGSQLVRIPRSGHLTPIEEPEAVNAALEAFLAEVDG